MSYSSVTKDNKENLKQRAYLNSLTNIIDFSVLQLTGFIVSPFIVSGLGSAMYGVWQMLSQMTGYAQLADTRATQVLKWTVAKKKDIVSAEELRSDVTSALIVTFLILPLVLIVGGIMSWYAPDIISADAAYETIIRVSCSLLIFSLVISKLFDIYESVLRGMNLSYKLMGLRAAVVIIGGVLKVSVLALGYGLIGLSLVQVILSIITGVTFYFIVRRTVSWFGMGKTDFKRVKSFSRLSGWYLADNGANLLLTNSDKILLGYLAGPTQVTFYTLTLFLPAALQGMINRVILGVIPGISKLIALKEYEKISRVKINIDNISYLLTTATGVVIIAMNKSFLSAWVGDDMYAGDLANLLIMVMILQDIFLKHDSYIVNATLDIKQKVFLTLFSGISFSLFGYFLAKEQAIVGLCISLLLGKLILQLGQQKILRQKINLTSTPLIQRAHPLVVALLLLISAAYASSFLPTLSLPEMVLLAPVLFIAAFGLFWAFGLTNSSRKELISLFMSIQFFKSD